MATRKGRIEVSPIFSSILKDPEDPKAGFKDIKPEELKITAKGEQFGKERGDVRFLDSGVIFLHLSSSKTIRARSHDVSLTGIGICIDKKLKSYRLGEKCKLEFAQPHALQNILIDVELRRVAKDDDGSSRLGFSIVSSNKSATKKIGDFIARLRSLDPWAR